MTLIIIAGFREDFVICFIETVDKKSEWLSRWSQSYICTRWTFHHTTLFRSALNSNEDVADYLISTIRICNGIYQNCVQAACQNSTLIWSHGLTQ